MLREVRDERHEVSHASRIRGGSHGDDPRHVRAGGRGRGKYHSARTRRRRSSAAAGSRPADERRRVDLDERHAALAAFARGATAPSREHATRATTASRRRSCCGATRAGWPARRSAPGDARKCRPAPAPARGFSKLRGRAPEDTPALRRRTLFGGADRSRRAMLERPMLPRRRHRTVVERARRRRTNAASRSRRLVHCVRATFRLAMLIGANAHARADSNAALLPTQTRATSEHRLAHSSPFGWSERALAGARATRVDDRGRLGETREDDVGRRGASAHHVDTARRST